MPKTERVEYLEKPKIKIGNNTIELRITDHPQFFSLANDWDMKYDMMRKAFEFIVFDVSNRDSFDELEYFISNFERCGRKPIFLWIIGNKTDK